MIIFALDCGMVGSSDQVVIVNSDESTTIVGDGKPRLTYTLAETSSIQVILFIILHSYVKIHLKRLVSYRHQQVILHRRQCTAEILH